MKKFLKLFFISFLLVLNSCSSVEPKQENNTESEYNEKDMAAYAKFINELGIKNGISTFLWDCSTHMNRNELKINYPKYIEAIINCYDTSSDKGNTGDDEIFEEEDSYTAVSNFKAGWNLGNTLDSTSYDISKIGTDEEEGWILKYGKKDSNGNYLPSNWETAWGQPETNQEIADFIINNGFNSIRIPVTWAEHLDKDNKVDDLWMERVKETVDYFYKRGVYCIVNVHHDGGANGWIGASEELFNEYSGRFEKLWGQIAECFKNYDERLLFESMNEVLDGKQNWNTPSEESLEYINKFNQIFVDTVRKTGGNNSNRNLIVMTYAGAGSEQILSAFKLPTDSAKNHLIVEVHNYDPTAFTWTTANWTQMTAIWNEDVHGELLRNEFEIYKQYSERLGAPFIVGEYNADPKKYEDYD